jgi:hypothetical protein
MGSTTSSGSDSASEVAKSMGDWEVPERQNPGQCAGPGEDRRVDYVVDCTIILFKYQLQSFNLTFTESHKLP